ncbi:hypothetical protein [Streptomyces acidicola]|uniref:hypothetical protein n=1 Tax=Streptomyces acidicola TaxID=2596892 RepID=UPI003448744D
MTASDPFAGPSPLIVLLIIVVGGITAFGLAGYGFGRLGRHGVRGSGPEVVLPSLAALAGAAALAMYVWGAVHLLLDETMTTDACREAVGEQHAAGIDRYDVSYVPLRLGCHVEGVGTYAAAVPGYVNPAAVGLALTGVVLMISGGFVSELRARHDLRKETSS